MAEEFGDEQIRVELKRLVENFRATVLRKMKEIESEAEIADGAAELQVQKLRERLEESKADLSLRTKQMLHFIERR
ncbi:MAG TPA: hypothetical protein VFI88_05040 [Sphingomicrobium sp.]|jgi:ElaB/YqjD/DUF883 family membrane-anchored ribosome-binding protein|nr:hypothetical protein [Sphingomicrobium sp.]